MIGETVSHYRITEKLGGGGMGVVYRALDTRLGRDVALKFLPAELTGDPDARERFTLEARAASALDHANICTIHDIDETPDGRLFIAMAFYDGETLKAKLAAGPLPIDEAIEIGRQIAAGLERAHESGIVHRDIKPANVMITDRGEARIVDFGIAKLAGDAGLTRTGTTLGTVSYMSPEQAEGGEVGPPADVWALGVVLYEALTGELPFVGASETERIASILARDPAPPSALRPEVPPALDDLVLEMLAKEPAGRPGSAGLVQARLEALVRPAVAETPLHRRATTWIAAAATVVVLAAALVIPARQRARVDDARASLPRIDALADSGRYEEAYALAVRAEDILGEDPVLQRLMPEVSDVISVTSDPEGARVLIEPVTAGDDGSGSGADPRTELGRTPIPPTRLPRGDYYIVVAADGYEPVERMATSRPVRRFPNPNDIIIDVTLAPEGELPEEMVPVEGGAYSLVSADAPAGLVSDLADFLIDRFEVTNESYREFVRDGGYADTELWSRVLEDPLAVERVVAGFVDRTGLPGPR
ncbi:MAG: protein kinase, partial [Gemmatimonadota bacterium]|nr:protein kinase [Gemmatimonadota bacterium]